MVNAAVTIAAQLLLRGDTNPFETCTALSHRAQEAIKSVLPSHMDSLALFGDIRRMGWGIRSVLVLASAISLGAANPPQPQTQSEQNQTTSELKAGTTRIVEAISNINPKKDPGCEDRQDKRSSDLCAQWGAVDAARKAAQATWLAVLLSFVGTVLIALTFAETRMVARRELRAYIAIDGVGLFFNGATGETTAHLKILNNGRTPAFDASWGGNIVVRSERQMELDMAATKAANYIPQGRLTVTTIHGGQNANAVLYGQPPIPLNDYRRAVQGDELNLYVFGTVWYRDAFKRRRYANFCFEAETLLPLDKGKKPATEAADYTMTPFHNDSD